MKKLGLIMVLIIVYCSVSYGQLFPPIQQYRENGYSNQDFINFSLNQESDEALRMKNRDLSASYREQTLLKVNNFLRETGLDKKYGTQTGAEGINWIFNPCRTWTENRIYPNGHWNTRQSRDGKRSVPYWEPDYFQGPVKVLHVDGYILDIGKDICMNLTSDPKVTIKNTAALYQTEISSDDKLKLRQITTLPYDYGDYNKKVVEKKIDLGLTNQKEEKKFRWKPVIIVGGITIGATGIGYAVYELFFDKHHHGGGPGGESPTTHHERPVPVITPPVVPVPVVPGGPGGAPATTGGK